ncbi:JDVT-CTERM system glutamic-type intramembrane protease MrtJ [Thiomicrorhabdus heinhorstiae]|uniref:JDVT-CTERM system CAAX-type protease n=1 Tax=Thiomicrorhabdus heinhorstiae TaxID=2748010 RepID=A0ABS0C151_9GAMM|nr:JDVT-CTERM system glutamic-type intramembrane protease [Thiomicrorhabdus heinhorstiae]MBF6059015.1 JDVT-CTERM system CAAX-type protease [Thiomicrorhabdus heinhorstiae]
MTSVKRESFWQRELGLYWTQRCFKDPWFYSALLAAPLLLLLGRTLVPEWLTAIPLSWMVFFLMVIWQPLIEELFFRGLLQGKLSLYAWFAENWFGLSRANWVVSIVFTSFHLFYHPPIWALAVLIPSLIFGWFRDRYQSVFPAIFLHAFYNAVLLFFSAN